MKEDICGQVEDCVNAVLNYLRPERKGDWHGGAVESALLHIPSLM